MPSARQGKALPTVAMIAALSLCGVCRGADSTCLDAQEREWLKKTYADNAARFDLTAIARRLLELNNVTQDLKDQLGSCRKTAPAAQADRCDDLRRQLDARMTEQIRAAELLRIALQMQTFLATLQLRLEQRPCEQ